jgi:hypothetical protein
MICVQFTQFYVNNLFEESLSLAIRKQLPKSVFAQNDPNPPLMVSQSSLFMIFDAKISRGDGGREQVFGEEAAIGLLFIQHVRRGRFKKVSKITREDLTAGKIGEVQGRDKGRERRVPAEEDKDKVEDEDDGGKKGGRKGLGGKGGKGKKGKSRVEWAEEVEEKDDEDEDKEEDDEDDDEEEEEEEGKETASKKAKQRKPPKRLFSKPAKKVKELT